IREGIKKAMGRLGSYKKEFESLNTKEKLLYPLKKLNNKFWSSKTRMHFIDSIYAIVTACYKSTGQRMPEVLIKQVVFKAMGEAQVQYRPTTYKGNVVIFRSPHLYKDPYLGWRDLIKGQIKTYNVPGHCRLGNDIFREPHVEHLVEQLKKHLL
ncbi:hypothetical protein, partial [Segetibacter sp.]|uniref:thioesterase domain-containing protein n=1 Tax=Segetibacter sp. TaxID=2231182 RepID=UPI00262319DD